MAIKELQTRITLKYDSYTNWSNDSVTDQGANLVLLKGEIGICEIPSGNNQATTAPTVLFKVGDGTTPFKNLKWASALAADVYSWAKASDVIVDGKTIKFVDGAVDATGNKVDKVITLNFATPEEVEEITDDLASRISALEGKFNDSDDGSVQNQINALDDRLDIIEGDGDGSINKALADAKAYTDVELGNYVSGVEGEEGYVAASGIRAEIATAEADAKSYADGIVATEKEAREAADSALADRIDAIVGTEGVEGTLAAGDKATLEAAKDYADGLAGNYDAAGSAATAEANAKTYTDEQLTVLTTTGKVKVNEEAIAAMDAAYKAADEALEDKIDDLETRIGNVTNVMNFRGAVDAEGDITDPVQGDVITIKGTGVEKVYSDGAWIEIGTASASDAAIALLQGRMDTAESDIDKLEKADEDLAAEDTAIKGRLDVIEGTGVGSIKKAQADAEATAKSYTDGRETVIRSELKTAYEAYADGKASAAETAAKSYADGIVATEKGAREAADSALDNRMTTAEGNIVTLQSIVNSGEGKTIRDDVTALQTLTGDNGAIRQEIAAVAKSVLDLANGQVTTNKTNIEDHETRIAAIEGDYLKQADAYIFNCGSSTTVTHVLPKTEPEA